jgi:hypothetical protein
MHTTFGHSRYLGKYTSSKLDFSRKQKSNAHSLVAMDKTPHVEAITSSTALQTDLDTATFPKFDSLPKELQLKVRDQFITDNSRPQLVLLYKDESDDGTVYPRAHWPYGNYWMAALQTSIIFKKQALNPYP